MTDKSRESSRSTRIRDNQRRSRAQRKEYLDSLQRRIHEYERRGVEATVEVQQAAKAVARENAGLRRLLARYGVSEEEIGREIQAVALESVNFEAPRPCVQQEQAQRKIISASSKEPCNKTATGPETHSAHTTPLRPVAATATTKPPPNPPLVVSEKSCPAETSCIDAATIIAQMRGDGDAEYARSMLGCEGTTDCRVKNTMLFQVFDKI